MWNVSENRKGETVTCPTSPSHTTRPSRGLPVASCAWQLSLAGPAVAGRLCGSSGQSSLAPSMLLQLPPSALLSVLCADTTALRAILGSARCGRSGCEAGTAMAGAHSAPVRQAYGRGLCNNAALTRAHVQCEEAARAWPVDLAGRPAHTSVQAPGEVRWA